MLRCAAPCLQSQQRLQLYYWPLITFVHQQTTCECTELSTRRVYFVPPGMEKALVYVLGRSKSVFWAQVGALLSVI